MVRALVIVTIIAAAFGCGGKKPATSAPTSAPLEASEEALDAVTLTDGQQVYGRVIHEGPDMVIVGQPSGTYTLKRSEVASIQRHSGKRGMSAALAHSTRLPAFESMLEVVARQPWLSQVRQVPATVISIGDLRDIPYVSHRAGDIEFNVYGDPHHPAGIEVGIYKADADEATREQLRSLIVDVLSSPEDKAALRALSLEKDWTEIGGLHFNIDPPSAADSFGGWWVTVYDRDALDRARASAAELGSLTTAVTPTTTATDSGWSASDHGYSSHRSSSPSSSSGGRVYVRGYTRKNGSYVPPHTRSAPRRRR